MYWMPKTLEELRDAIKEVNEKTWICAGGTDLVIALREKKKFHYSLLDLTHIEEFKKVEELENKLKIGAVVTMDDLERSSIIKKYMPALLKAASMVGSTQIRNRATIGGNVANASQSSDLTPVLMAYEAEVVVLDNKGNTRTLPIDELVLGLGKTSLKPHEVILYFLVEKKKGYSAFSKVGSRKAVAISKINACMQAEIRAGCLKNVSVYLGAVGAKAKKAPGIEAGLEGKLLSTLPNKELREAVYGQIEENIPDRSSKHYKKPAAYGAMCDIVEAFRDFEKGGHRE